MMRKKILDENNMAPDNNVNPSIIPVKPNMIWSRVFSSSTLNFDFLCLTCMVATSLLLLITIFPHVVPLVRGFHLSVIILVEY